MYKKVKEIAQKKLVLLKELRGNQQALAVLLSGLHPAVLFALMRMAEDDRIFVAKKNLWQKVATEYFARRTNQSREYFEQFLVDPETEGDIPETRRLGRVPYNYFHMILSHYCIYTFLYVHEATWTAFENFEQIETMQKKSRNHFESRPVVFYIKGYGQAFSLKIRKVPTSEPTLIVTREDWENENPIPDSSWGKIQVTLFESDQSADISWGHTNKFYSTSKSWRSFGKLFATLYRFLQIGEDLFVAMPFNENTPEESLEKINKQVVF